MDWGAEGLLAGLEGDEREARVRLLDALHADGVATEELRAAVAEDRLVLVPIERALLAPACHTLAEAAQRGGLAVDAAEGRLRALGVTIPDDPDLGVFGDDDVEALRRGRAYADAGISLEQARPVTNMLSGAMARGAEPLRRLFADTFLHQGDSEADLALRFGEKAAELTPLLAADLDYLLRLHLREHARSDALTLADRSSGELPDAFDVGVAFADIVGFTALGEELPEGQLTDIAQRLESLASAHVRPPVRVVKAIGDAVMIVSRELPALMDAVVDLMATAEADVDFPPLRAGIVHGRAVARLGDWYGPTVNLASRLTQRARRGSVLTTNATRDALGADAAGRYRFSEAGNKRFKGIADPVPTLRLRLAAED